MCLFKTHILPKLAMKPITVYKELLISSSGHIITPCMHVTIKLNHIMHANRHWSHNLLGMSIESQGVHAYNNINGLFLFNSYSTEIKGLGHFYTIAVKAIIPRFSLYWEGIDYDVASSRLFITNELKCSSIALPNEVKKLFK